MAGTSARPKGFSSWACSVRSSAEPLQRLNGYKNVLALVVNLVAAVLFVIFAREHIDWLVVVLIAAGSALGGVPAPVSGDDSPRTASGLSSSSSASSRWSS